MPLLHPAFLLALIAAGIPIIIHLSRRRKFKTFDMGTLRFLQLAEKKRNLRLRVEELALLLLRIAAVAVIALLFARPYMSDRDHVETANDKVIVLLDASGSMTPEMAEKARSAARKAIRKYGAAGFARFSDGVQTIASIDDYQPIAGAPGDFGKALGWALDQLRMEGIENARVILIGHFAAAGLPSAPPRVWPPRVRVDAIAVDPPGNRNEAVRGVELLTPYAAAAMEIEARVSPSAAMREVTLSAEGLNLKKEVPPGVERVRFSFRPPREEVRGWISMKGNDAWPADDSSPFAVRWGKPEPVLVLDGFPGSTPFEGQGYFLQKALAASGAAHGMSPFLPQIRFGLEGRQGLADLKNFSAIAICGPTAISSSEAAAIKERVAAGAGLLVAIDERWTPEATAALTAEGLFPESVSFSGGMQQRRLAFRDRKHPALAAFDGKDGGDLRELPWRDAFTLQADDTWKTLASLDGGHPVLLEKAPADGKSGRVMVLAHPLTREWTDLPREPLFVPLAKSLFTTLTRYESRPASADVLTPGIRENREIGHYQKAGGSFEVVAADPAEAPVTAVDAAAFRKAFGLPDPSDAQAPAVTKLAHDSGLERPRAGEWWPWLVLALLLLLTVECAVSTSKPARMEPLTASES